MREPAVQIRCRKEDLHLVQPVVESACEIYASKAKVPMPEAYVDEKIFLPGPQQPGVHRSSW
jgi:V-type H+-transporting ATPase subunit E